MNDFAPKYDLFVFDWDGTVMDTTALIAKGIQHAAREMGFAVPAFRDACGVIGLDWHTALLKVVPDCPESEHMRFGEIYRAWYIPHEADVILFPGMRELIVGLHTRGLRTAVATGKSREGLRRVFDRTGLESFFLTTQTASECLPKPNAEMLEKIGIELDVAPERTVMIGDTTHDVVMAHRYGCDAVAMTYGASTLEDQGFQARGALSRRRGARAVFGRFRTLARRRLHALRPPSEETKPGRVAPAGLRAVMNAFSFRCVSNPACVELYTGSIFETPGPESVLLPLPGRLVTTICASMRSRMLLTCEMMPMSFPLDFWSVSSA